MIFMSLYSGTLTTGQALLNPALNVKEKISRIFLMHANQRQRLQNIGAGHIFGVLGLKSTRTGDTLCAPENPILLESIDSYEPVISQAVEPATLREKDKLEEALGKLADEDPTFRWREDTGTGQTIISGMGELHLDILADRLKREFKVEVRTGRPQVVYHETIQSNGSHRERFERTTEEAGAIYGDVTVSVEPKERGTGHDIVWDWSPDSSDVPAGWGANLQKLILDGAQQGLHFGPLGHPLADVKLTIKAVGINPEAPPNVGYTIAVSTAVRGALEAASPVMLAPVANVEITTPTEFTGDCISSINQRRGRIDAIEERSTTGSVVMASVSMEQMFGYATELRSLTQGRASFTMTFSHYDAL
jgi:elongation factor G